LAFLSEEVGRRPRESSALPQCSVGKEEEELRGGRHGKCPTKLRNLRLGMVGRVNKRKTHSQPACVRGGATMRQVVKVVEINLGE